MNNKVVHSFMRQTKQRGNEKFHEHILNIASSEKQAHTQEVKVDPRSRSYLLSYR